MGRSKVAMSYTKLVKDELISSNKTLDIHELLGCMYTRSSMKKDFILFSSISIAMHFHNLIKSINEESKIVKVGRKFRIIFNSKVIDRLEEIKIYKSTKISISNLLKGIFISSGYLSNPNKSYSLDIYFEDKKYLDNILRILTKQRYNARSSIHKNKYRLSLRNFDNVITFLLDIGATESFFNYEDIKIIREAKESNNRDINLTLANDERLAISSSRQRSIMENIKKRGMLNKLNNKLQEVIKARLSNPDMSLNQLSHKIGISKSGLRNRIKLIEQIANK